MTDQHTPGPWHVTDDNITVMAGREYIAQAQSLGSPQTTVADARLIAAAPTMLGALRGLTCAVSEAMNDGKPIEQHGGVRGAFAAAEAALAAATGNE